MIVGMSSDKPLCSGKPCGLRGDLWSSLVTHQRYEGELRSCFAVILLSNILQTCVPWQLGLWSVRGLSPY